VYYIVRKYVYSVLNTFTAFSATSDVNRPVITSQKFVLNVKNVNHGRQETRKDSFEPEAVGHEPHQRHRPRVLQTFSFPTVVVRHLCIVSFREPQSDPNRGFSNGMCARQQ